MNECSSLHTDKIINHVADNMTADILDFFFFPDVI